MRQIESTHMVDDPTRNPVSQFRLCPPILWSKNSWAARSALLRTVSFGQLGSQINKSTERINVVGPKNDVNEAASWMFTAWTTVPVASSQSYLPVARTYAWMKPHLVRSKINLFEVRSLDLTTSRELPGIGTVQTCHFCLSLDRSLH
jgi:hypothetical protein